MENIDATNGFIKMIIICDVAYELTKKIYELILFFFFFFFFYWNWYKRSKVDFHTL